MQDLKNLVQKLLQDGNDDEVIVSTVREAIDELIGSVPDGEQSRFNQQTIEEEAQFDDIKETYDDSQLIGIVDEAKGGFIGYAIGQEHADLITKSLVNTKGIFWEIEKPNENQILGQSTII